MFNPILLERLDAIGSALAHSGHALALIGLGSVGQDTDRLDAYSDLDFFAIVQAGHKAAYLHDLSWLSTPAPLAYAFMNTADGYKALYADGIFCEFAVFEPAELTHIPFAPGRVVWRDPAAPTDLHLPRQRPAPPEPRPTEWLVGEALTNLYVGLGRFARGERLSAFRFVQHYAVDRVLDLITRDVAPMSGQVDVFGAERRFEQRYPEFATLLATLMPGYAHTPQAARAVLAFLSTRYPVNPAMQAAIVRLCDLFL